MKRHFKKIIFCLIFFSSFLAWGNVQAGTCWSGGYSGTAPWAVKNSSGADSCEYTDVNYCVNTVAAEGDIVNVGAGSAIWTTRLVLAKGIDLVGAGVDLTTITNGISSTCEYGEACSVIQIRPSSYTTNHKIRVTGFTFNANSKRTFMLGYAENAPFGLQTNVRIHHNKINGPGISGGAFFNMGSLYGVVDNNTITGFWYPVSHSGASISQGWWSNSPQNIFSLGSQYYMYFEDNTFNQNGVGSEVIISNGQYSSRYVFRYNTIVNTALTYQLWEIHGYQGGVSDTNMDSCFGAEIYGNKITHPAGASLGFWKQRSGQARVFNNTYSGGPNESYYIPYTGTSEYQCPSSGWINKLTHNSYFWGNRKDYTGALFQLYEGNKQDCHDVLGVPMTGRDVFADDPVYDAGNDIHVNCGALADLPAICKVGQGYWATNQSCTDLTGMVGINPPTPISGQLYKCTSTNVWTAEYIPYTYPHPLRNESPAVDTTAPVAPTNLSVS